MDAEFNDMIVGLLFYSLSSGRQVSIECINILHIAYKSTFLRKVSAGVS